MSWFDDDDDDDDDLYADREADRLDPFRIPRAFRHGAGADTSCRTETPIPLADLADPLPPPARPQRARAPEPEVAPRLDLFVLADDGEPIEAVRLHVSDDFGHTYDLTTDEHGYATCDLAIDATHSIRLAKTVDLSKVPRSQQHVACSLATFWIAPHDTTDYFIGSFRRPVTFVLERPKATIVSLDGWREGQAVLVFGAARERDDGSTTTVRAILRTALALAGTSPILVVGHADTKGGADDNDALAAERATSVGLYLSGERDAWAQHAYEHANMTTLKAALAWAAATFGLDCDPGPVGPGWNTATASALNVLRLKRGLPEAKYGPEDWAALYDLYDVELAAILYTDVAGLAARKQAVRLSDDDVGERWPVDAPELDEHDSPQNRRVDLVICPGSAPRASIDEIYNGTFTCTHVPVPPEAKVRLRTVTTAFVSLGLTRVSLQIGAIQTEIVADELGRVEFTALRGEPITVLACTDLWAASRLVWGAYTDMASLGDAGSER